MDQVVKQLTNTTGQEISIFDKEGGLVRKIPTSPAYELRLGEKWPEENVGSQYIVVSAPEYTGLQGHIPDGPILVTLLIAGNHEFPNNRVFVADYGPEGVVRDEKGGIIGTKRLIDYSSVTDSESDVPEDDTMPDIRKFHNTTPHNIVLCHQDGTIDYEITPSDKHQLRLREKPRAERIENGIVVVDHPEYDGIDGDIPDGPIITSMLVGKWLAKKRKHVYGPDMGPKGIVKGTNGRPVGTKRLVKYSIN